VPELSICEAMLRQLRDLCAVHGAAGVEPELLEHAFSVAGA